MEGEGRPETLQYIRTVAPIFTLMEVPMFTPTSLPVLFLAVVRSMIGLAGNEQIEVD